MGMASVDPELITQVKAVFAEVLGCGCPPDADFRTLGGDSIAAVQITARLREQLAVELAIDAVFSHPSVRSMAAHIQGRSSR